MQNHFSTKKLNNENKNVDSSDMFLNNDSIIQDGIFSYTIILTNVMDQLNIYVLKNVRRSFEYL